MSVNPQIYRDAAEYLRQHGWYQGDLTNNPPENIVKDEYKVGAACINGALLIAAEFPVNYPTYEKDEYAAVAAEVAQTLQLSITEWEETNPGDWADAIETWNDARERSEAEVLKALEATATRLEKANG